jgi:hypothetical protein
MLLDVPHLQLHLKIVRILPRDFLQPEEDRLQSREVGDLFDLLVQRLQLVERIHVLWAHDVILHF